MNFLSKTPSGLRRLAVCAVVIIAAPTVAMAATVTMSSGTGTRIHYAGEGGVPAPSALSIQATSSPSLTYSSTVSFSGGTTKGKAGLGRNVSSTLAKVILPTGIGVDQTDPAHTQDPSTLRIDFTAIFDITGSGSFGPAINSVFSVPFGAKIGPGGTAGFTAHVEWAYRLGGAFAPMRTNYDASVSYFNPGGSSMDVLTSFTAPSAPFSPTSIPAGPAGTNQLRVLGHVIFSANNADAPVTVVFPRDAIDGTDPGDTEVPFDFYAPTGQPGTPEFINSQRILEMIPEVGFEVGEEVPEPAFGVLAAGAALLLSRRRRPA